jgi:hypothetical protein
VPHHDIDSNVAMLYLYLFRFQDFGLDIDQLRTTPHNNVRWKRGEDA